MAQNSIKVKIIGKAGDKTVVGESTYLYQHPIYRKYIKRTKKYMIHDDKNEISVGDEIFIRSTRPISKKKVWIVVNKKEGEQI